MRLQFCLSISLNRYRIHFLSKIIIKKIIISIKNNSTIHVSYTIQTSSLFHVIMIKPSMPTTFPCLALIMNLTWSDHTFHCHDNHTYGIHTIHTYAVLQSSYGVLQTVNLPSNGTSRYTLHWKSMDISYSSYTIWSCDNHRIPWNLCDYHKHCFYCARYTVWVSKIISEHFNLGGGDVIMGIVVDPYRTLSCNQ